jgi:hypothetical protein
VSITRLDPVLSGVIIALSNHLGDFLAGKPNYVTAARLSVINPTWVNIQQLLSHHQHVLDNDIFLVVGGQGKNIFATQQPKSSWVETGHVTACIENLRSAISSAKIDTTLDKLWSAEGFTQQLEKEV